MNVKTQMSKYLYLSFDIGVSFGICPPKADPPQAENLDFGFVMYARLYFLQNHSQRNSIVH